MPIHQEKKRENKKHASRMMPVLFSSFLTLLFFLVSPKITTHQASQFPFPICALDFQKARAKSRK